MEKLEKYISDLLWKHDCVVVPGFGGFLLNQKPRGFEGSSHELRPPGKRISFNRSLINNDGLLQHYVAQVTGQSFENAQSFVTTQSNYWKLQLLNKKPVTLAGIGTLNADVEGRWIFSPAAAVFSKESFGLESIQLSPLENAPSIRIQAPERKKVAVVAGPKKQRVWLRRTVVAVTVMCLLAVAGYFIAPQLKDMPQLGSFDFWREGSKQPKTETVPEIKKEVQPEVIAPSPMPEITTTDATVDQAKFYIIGGSFAKEKNALKFQAELRGKGFQAEILHNENGFFRVAYVNDTDSLAASRELKKIKTDENQAAWLLKW